MRFFAINLFLVALATASPIVEYLEPHGDAPDKKDVRIKSITFQGTGCPAGTVSLVGEGEDGTGLSVAFSKFENSPLLPGASPTSLRKFCNIHIRFDYPEGWSYTITKAVVKGYVNVPKQCTAQFKTVVNYTGQGLVMFNGPADRYFKEYATISPLEWSQCSVKGKEGLPLIIQSDLAVHCKNTYQFTVSELQWLLQWKKC